MVVEPKNATTDVSYDAQNVGCSGLRALSDYRAGYSGGVRTLVDLQMESPGTLP